MSDFPLARILDFVRTVPPFEALEHPELEKLVRQMDIAYFPPGHVVIEQNGDPAENLYIIHSGSVRLTTREDSGQDILIDIRGEGDTFGASGILRGTGERFSATAQEDLLAFELPSDRFRQLVSDNQAFRSHYMVATSERVRAIADLNDGLLYNMTGAEPLSEMAVRMHTPVSELMSTEVLSCHPDTSISKAARLMTERNAGSVVVMDSSGGPLGLVTDRDLRSRVLAEGLSADLPVKKIMSWPLKTLPTKAVAYEAVLEMTRHGIHHLVVTQGGDLAGIISDHDISVITGNNPVGLVRRIDKVDTLEELRRLPRRGYRALYILLRQGVSAELMLDLLSEFHDRLIEKVLQLTENQMESDGLGRCPTDFAWLVLGNLGRRAPVPPLYQHHMLAYSDVGSSEKETTQTWFLEFARRASRSLEQCGFPPSPTQEVATNPRWCNSLSNWRSTFRQWIQDPEHTALDPLLRFFDMRPIHQTTKLTESLHMAIFEDLDGNPGFLSLLGRLAVGDDPPLGFFRDSVVAKDGKYLSELNLTRHASGPIIDSARVLALDMRTTTTSTRERLQSAAHRGLLPGELVGPLTEGLSFVTLFRIARYLEARAKDTAPQDVIGPAELNKTQRNILKQCFATNDKLRQHMLLRYAS